MNATYVHHYPAESEFDEAPPEPVTMEQARNATLALSRFFRQPNTFNEDLGSAFDQVYLTQLARGKGRLSKHL
jgi:hypothetical protein